MSPPVVPADRDRAAEADSRSALAEDLLAATRQRLTVVAPTLLGSSTADGDGSVADLLQRVTLAVADNPALDRVWRLVVGLTGCYPDASTVHLARRRLRLAPAGAEVSALLDALLEGDVTRYDPSRRAVLVDRGVLVDVDFCATEPHHNTGIQRVVRQTMRRWDRDRPAQLTAWTRRQGGLRELTAGERGRVVSWGEHQTEAGADDTHLPLIIPYRSVLVLPEVAKQPLCGPLASLASLSDNRVAMVVHDCIPISSAGAVPRAESERFTKYLAVVKSAHLVSGVSETAAAEFQGFADAVTAQGLPGPRVIAVRLPVDEPDRRPSAGDTVADPTPELGEPLILVVGSHEPRKNHGAVVFAAQSLWGEGLKFRLRFVGGGDRRLTRPFDRAAQAMAERGLPVEVWRSADDSQLLASYRAARFTVFPSLHEGFGLPVAESLALGVPVITSDYGSTAEIAEDGGCLLVDPRSDDAVTSAIRSLLTDDALYWRLVAECSARQPRTWQDYADDLWTEAVEPLLEPTR